MVSLSFILTEFPRKQKPRRGTSQRDEKFHLDQSNLIMGPSFVEAVAFIESLSWEESNGKVDSLESIKEKNEKFYSDILDLSGKIGELRNTVSPKATVMSEEFIETCGKTETLVKNLKEELKINEIWLENPVIDFRSIDGDQLERYLNAYQEYRQVL